MLEWKLVEVPMTPTTLKKLFVLTPSTIPNVVERQKHSKLHRLSEDINKTLRSSSNGRDHHRHEKSRMRHGKNKCR